MKCEKTQNVWKITDQFGDFIHLTEKELLKLYDEIAGYNYKSEDKEDGSNDR